jgi:hypothetical protein
MRNHTKQSIICLKFYEVTWLYCLSTSTHMGRGVSLRKPSELAYLMLELRPASAKRTRARSRPLGISAHVDRGLCTSTTSQISSSWLSLSSIVYVPFLSVTPSTWCSILPSLKCLHSRRTFASALEDDQLISS